MKVIKRDLGENFKSIKLLALSDLHIGDELCNLKLIRQVLNEVKESPNTFIILNGDLMNNSTKSSVGDVYNEQMTPTEQILKLCEILEQTKGKVLIYIDTEGINQWYNSIYADETSGSLEPFDTSQQSYMSEAKDEKFHSY